MSSVLDVLLAKFGAKSTRPERAYPKLLDVQFGSAKAKFDMSSEVARTWFFPRCQAGRHHEPPISEFLIQHLQRSDVFLDIGANVGYFSILASFFCKAVHAFEVDPSLIVEEVKNRALNNKTNIHIVNAACWRDDGRLTAYAPHVENNLSTNMLLLHSAQASNFAVSLSIGTYCAETSINPTVAKMDIEGAEVCALQGMGTAVLRGLRLLLLEVHPELIERMGRSKAELLDILIEGGFSKATIITEHKTPGARAQRKAPIAGLLACNANAMVICEKA
jgi:FkbM family methyltransferase